MDPIPLSSISVGERARKDYGDLEGLKASLRRLGTIHPITLSRNGNFGYTIIAGGRRFESLKQLGVKELYHGSVLDPDRPGFLFKDEVPEHELRECELDENLYRLKTNWIEDVLTVDSIHKLKQRELGVKNWGLRQTGTLLGEGYTAGYLSYITRVAKLLRAGDKELIACNGLTEAIRVFCKRDSDKALAELNKRRVASLKKGGDANEAAPNSNDNRALHVPPQPTSNPSAVSPALPVEIPLSSMFLNGDCISLLKTHPLVDHIVTDIPYGIDMDHMNEAFVSDVRDEHDVESNVSMMPVFLKHAHAVIKPGGFCVFFYDLDHHEKLQSYARSAGFRVQRWPYIAGKPYPCKNSAAQYNTNKNYEACMFLRRDEKTVLRHPIMSSWGQYDFRVAQKQFDHPFAKPVELWRFIYDAIAFPGQTVLDPYCGCMSASVAAIQHGLVPYGIELVAQHYNKGLEHVRKAYTDIHKPNPVSFV